MMDAETAKKWIGIGERLTSTMALILIVLYLIWQSTGDRVRDIAAAKASAEEAVVVSRLVKDAMEGHTKLTSEDSSLNRMILIQICFNTAKTMTEAQKCQFYQQ